MTPLGVAIWATVQGAALWALPPLAAGPVWAQSLAAAGLAGVHLVVGLGLGLAVLRVVRCPLRSELGEGAAALFLGVGLLGTVVLLLGLLGLCGVGPLRVLMTLLAVAVSPLSGPRLAGLRHSARPRPAELPAHAIGALMVVVVALQAATPPSAFDALEYHLAVPRLWLRAGRIAPVPGNFFSHQPFGAEMNFLLGLALGADRLPTVPKFFNLGGLLAVMGLVLALARVLGMGRGARGVAVLAVAATPLTVKVCSDAFVDIWVVLGVLTAVKTWHRWLVSRRPGALIVAALALGTLMTLKHTATVIWVLPLLGLFAWTILSHRLCPPEWIISGAVLLVLALLPAAPWYLKEWLWTGNPIFPLGHGVLGGEGWSATQSQLLVGGHGLRSPLTGAFWVDAGARPLTVSPLCLSLGVGALGFAWRRRVRGLVGSTLGATVAAYLLWNLLAHSADRFIAPAAALLAPLGVGGLWAVFAWARRRLGRQWASLGALAAVVPLGEMLLWLRGSALAEAFALAGTLALGALAVMGRRVRAATVAGWAGLVPAAALTGLVLHSLSVAPQTPLDNLAWLSGRQSWSAFAAGLPHLQASQYLNGIERPQGRVLLIYESRTFNLDAPAVMGTVFDGQPLRDFVRGASALEEVHARLRAAGISHVFLNLFERDRLAATYFGGADAAAIRRLWDFPTPLREEEHRLIERFEAWAQREAVFRIGVWIAIARVGAAPSPVLVRRER